MTYCSIFQGVTHKVENATLEKIIKTIKTNKFKDQVDNIRDLKSKGKKDEADHKKKLLQSFTPSGTFDSVRKAEKITSYSKFIILDFDDLSSDQLKSAKIKAISINHTYAVFISPSGNGLKILVPVESELDQHAIAFNQVSTHYESSLGITVDQSGKDVSRLCFMSFDPDCFLNTDAVPFKLNQYAIQSKTDAVDKVAIEPKVYQIPDDEVTIAFERCVEFTSKKSEYLNGNRNNFIHQLACNTNRAGIPEERAVVMICDAYDLNTSEIIASTKSAYQNNIVDFAKNAKYAKPANTSNDNNIESFEDVLKSTPCIDDLVFNTLPTMLKSGCSVFSDVRKRDVFFTSAIAILSGCLPNVQGVYFDERVFPHLYTFIIAPAASGKGVLKNAKRLADKYHQKILSESNTAQADYNAQLAEHKAECSKMKKGDISPEQPEKPPFKIVFIPANCSASRMIEHLQNNGGMGIICETEADNMSGAKKQDWGDYSPSLRSAFHHETITFTRKTNNEYIEILEPRLALALSGTPSQAPRLIESAEDGLFSRFLFYAFKSNIIWQDPSPKANGVIHNDHFGALAEDLMTGINMLDASPTSIFLTVSQWFALNSTFTSILDEVVTFTGEDAAAIVYRLGLITYRICMVLTALRKIENADASEELYCSDIDFNISISLVKTYLQHSIIMYNNLPNSTESGVFKKGDNKKEFIDALPDEFTLKQAADIAKKFKLSYSTISKMLPKMVPSYFSQPKSGYYIKNKD